MKCFNELIFSLYLSEDDESFFFIWGFHYELFHIILCDGNSTPIREKIAWGAKVLEDSEDSVNAYNERLLMEMGIRNAIFSKKARSL